MARSKYIYLIYDNCDLLSAHTVKHEAHTWVRRSKWKFSEVQLYRMEDGSGLYTVGEGESYKPMKRLEWEDE